MHLYRPVGLFEWEKIVSDNAFPPRFDWQPIFYPVLNFEYASMIARQWNVKDANSGYVGIVTVFELPDSWNGRYPVQVVGGPLCQEWWVPAEDLDTLNAALLGPIVAVAAYYGEEYQGPAIALSPLPTRKVEGPF